MMITKEQVVAKWRVSQTGRMVESDEEFDVLESLVTAKIEESKQKLLTLESTFGSDVNTLLERMLNTDESIEALAMLSLREEVSVEESIVRHVNSAGIITRTKDRKTRERNATQTTGLTKGRRRQIARKAAKTRRANPSGQVRALRKTRKALKKRKQMGI